MMHWLDLLILAALALGIYRGFATGVIWQVTSILGLVVSFALAVQLMEEAGAVAARSLAISETIAPVIGFVLVFLAVRVVISALVRIVESLVSALRLSALNRVAGGAFGAFQAALILSLLFLVLDPLEMPDTSTREEATLYEPVAAVLPETWAYAREQFPRLKDLSEQFGEQIESEIFDEE